MVRSQQKSPLWQGTGNSQQLTVNSEEELKTELPCIDSGNECVEKLTESAIAKSNKLQKLDEKIALIDDRLKVMADRIDYSHKKGWTNYVTIDPVKVLQNIFGGGDVQKNKIAIADLEIKTADLEAAKAELERQREFEKTLLGEKVLRLVLDYESANRRYELLTSQLETLNQQREVTRIAYKFGEGNTSQILGMEDRRDRLNEQIVDVEIKKDEAVRELLQVTGYEVDRATTGVDSRKLLNGQGYVNQ
jgi:hypothetical protein